MAEYKQPTDDQLHEMMRRFIKTLPPTVCEVKRQEKKDEEKINVSHEAHDVFHGEVEHTILHSWCGICADINLCRKFSQE